MMADPYARVDVWTLAADDPIITAYAAAVTAMQQKSASDANDPTGWIYQANIHGTVAQATVPQWDQCHHGTWYFLPWHRMYVYYFEQIVRAYVIANGGPATWALPYWNYDGGGDTNQLPTAFRDPGSSLYVADRAPGINTGFGLATGPNGVTSPANALNSSTFTGSSEFGGGITSVAVNWPGFWQQTGRLEQTPHNDVHNAIGGLMGDPATAAQDPIFWLHHANIDRLWWLWAQTHSDPSDTRWAVQTFLVNGMPAFFDARGNPAGSALTCASVQDTAGQLGYTYDDLTVPPLPVTTVKEAAMTWPSPWPQRPPTPAASGPAPDRQLVGATEQPIRLVGDTVTVPVAIDERVMASLRAGQSRAGQQHRAFLDIEDMDAQKNPRKVYGVYVNLPGQPTEADRQAHHAGNISLFGVERARNPRGDEHPHGLSSSMDITSLLDRLAAEGKWTDGSQLTVTFQPITLQAPPGQELPSEVADTSHPDLPITIGRVSVHYA